MIVAIGRSSSAQTLSSDQASQFDGNAWLHMRQRCSNPKYHAYARYGGRGIQVCDRWRNSNRAGTAFS
jgi:hypothetical protein